MAQRAERIQRGQRPALIDAVIYQVMAAERRYEYLLRLAKSESLSCENIPIR